LGHKIGMPESLSSRKLWFGYKSLISINDPDPDLRCAVFNLSSVRYPNWMKSDWDWYRNHRYRIEEDGVWHYIRYRYWNLTVYWHPNLLLSMSIVHCPLSICPYVHMSICPCPFPCKCKRNMNMNMNMIFYTNKNRTWTWTWTRIWTWSFTRTKTEHEHEHEHEYEHDLLHEQKQKIWPKPEHIRKIFDTGYRIVQYFAVIGIRYLQHDKMLHGTVSD
jgi:hypothetical protein